MSCIAFDLNHISLFHLFIVHHLHHSTMDTRWRHVQAFCAVFFLLLYIISGGINWNSVTLKLGNPEVGTPVESNHIREPILAVITIPKSIPREFPRQVSSHILSRRQTSPPTSNLESSAARALKSPRRTQSLAWFDVCDTPAPCIGGTGAAKIDFPVKSILAAFLHSSLHRWAE